MKFRVIVITVEVKRKMLKTPQRLYKSLIILCDEILSLRIFFLVVNNLPLFLVP